jgi:hypothetical protein
METQIVKPRCQTVAIATVELVETLHQLFPDAVIKPSEPFEDEDVCLTVYGLWDVEELQRIRNQIYKLEFTLYDKYADGIPDAGKTGVAQRVVRVCEACTATSSQPITSTVRQHPKWEVEWIHRVVGA